MNKDGRPAHKPTEGVDGTIEKVLAWTKAGVSQARMATAMGISPITLRKHYREQLDEGAGEWEVKFEESIKARALTRDCAPAITIFLAKTQLLYREVVPVDPEKDIDVSKLTNDQLRKLIAERSRDRRRSGESGEGTAPPQRSTG